MSGRVRCHNSVIVQTDIIIKQRICDPATYTRLNAKISFIRSILQTEKQDDWDKFICSFDTRNNSIYKLNKCLLKHRPSTQPLAGPTGIVIPAGKKSEMFADSLELQFLLNPGPILPEVSNTMSHIKDN